MDMVSVTKEVPKDAKEVVDVIVKVAGHLLQKKPFTELLGSLPQVMQAVDGWENAVEAVKGKTMGETIGYFVGEVAELLEKDETEAPATPAEAAQG